MTRTTLLCAATALAIGAFATYAVTRPADAQNAPAATATTGPGDGPGWGAKWGRDGGRWGMGQDERFRHHHWMMARMEWGLFASVADKQLTTADVQTIAQGILLRHGNHSWKVADVVANHDNTISFAFTTGDNGGVVARFAIDTRTGRIQRVG